MSFITEEAYKVLFGDIASSDFLRRSVKAERIMNEYTTGIDGFAKLVNAKPTDESTLTNLRMCAAELIHTMSMIENTDKSATLVQRADGTFSPAVVSSVSSGSESITYSTGSTGSATVGAAIGSSTERKALFAGIVRDWLSGVTDANGVNLLYMGVYPNV